MTYIQFDGTSKTVEVGDGDSLMVGALANGIKGIDADCGGACACATCHVHVHPEWTGIVGAPQSEAEAELLELAPEVSQNSRLSCQIKMRPELDGVIVQLPEAQH